MIYVTTDLNDTRRVERMCVESHRPKRKPWAAIYSQQAQQTHGSGGTLLRVLSVMPEGSVRSDRKSFKKSFYIYVKSNQDLPKSTTRL